jgi:hypothetical protein
MTDGPLANNGLRELEGSRCAVLSSALTMVDETGKWLRLATLKCSSSGFTFLMSNMAG